MARMRATSLAAALLLGAMAAAPAGAVSVLNFGIGASGFGNDELPPNDDGSSNALLFPGAFTPNFFGTTYGSFFVNNNGNITFNNSVSGYTPAPFPISNQPMIAPFWADVDTRTGGCGPNGSDCGHVYIASPDLQSVAVTWHNVGYYSQNNDRTNTFQLLLTDRSAGNAPGDFDIEFRYERLEWTTGEASGGTGGLGGTPAQAGFDAGDGANFFVLPGSFTANVLDLQNDSNVGDPGRWVFAIRNGAPPGATPDNPILPVTTQDGFDFEFGVTLNQQVFIDPIVAIGYDYTINSGPNFASVLLPNIGDGLYDLYLWDGSSYVFDQALAAGLEFFFSAGGVDRFRILGIETSAGLDPTDPTAFVTGLTFVGAGTVQLSMDPLTFDTDPAQQTPEPVAIGLLGLGLAGLAWSRRRRLPTASQI